MESIAEGAEADDEHVTLEEIEGVSDVSKVSVELQDSPEIVTDLIFEGDQVQTEDAPEAELQDKQTEQSEVVASGDDGKSMAPSVQPCQLSFSNGSTSQAGSKMVEAEHTTVEGSMRGRWRKNVKKELKRWLKSKAKSVQSDVMFDWEKLDELDPVADEDTNEQELSLNEDKPAEPVCDMKITGNSFQKIKEFLEREFREAAEAGEDIELIVRRLRRDLTGECNALDEDPKKLVGLVDEGRYYRIKNGITMDSGCSVFVMPSGWIEMFELEESEGSKRGQTFQAAAKNSKPIKNEGQRTIKFLTKENEKRKMTCQVAAVNKILASVAQICDGGNEVLFRYGGGEIRHLKSGKVTFFRRVGNVYAMDAWIAKTPDEPERPDMDVDTVSTGFTRPVAP